MRVSVAVLALCVTALNAAAREVVSAYTDIDTEAGCSVFATAEEGDGDWANLACAGYKGYPVIVYYADARDSVFYGFPPAGDLAPVWESFDAFNTFAPRIEWRIEKDGGRETPFATIHRWFVSDPEDEDEKIEVLVVEKVGQIHERDGCAVGYVVATGNTDANEKARAIADNQARDFVCGDQPTIDAGSVAVPSFSRGDY